MTFWTFILIVIAVALWVSRWLKIHENPEWFSDFIVGLLKLVWGVIKYIWLPLLAIWLIILWVMRVKDSVDIDKVSTWGANIIMWLFIWILIYLLGLWIYKKFKKARENLKGKKGFIDMCKELFRERKEDREKKKKAKAKKLAEMSEEELKRYKKIKRDEKIIIITFIILAIPMLLSMIISLFE